MLYPKLTTSGARLLHGQKLQNTLKLDQVQRDQFISREKIKLRPDQLRQITSAGYVVVFYEEVILGLGLLLGDLAASDMELTSFFPKR